MKPPTPQTSTFIAETISSFYGLNQLASVKELECRTSEQRWIVFAKTNLSTIQAQTLVTEIRFECSYALQILFATLNLNPTATNVNP